MRLTLQKCNPSILKGGKLEASHAAGTEWLEISVAVRERNSAPFRVGYGIAEGEHVSALVVHGSSKPFRKRPRDPIAIGTKY